MTRSSPADFGLDHAARRFLARTSAFQAPLEAAGNSRSHLTLPGDRPHCVLVHRVHTESVKADWAAARNMASPHRKLGQAEGILRLHGL